ncbi:hypothetical protein HW555_013658, partial [Spodoptera exigua]
ARYLSGHVLPERRTASRAGAGCRAPYNGAESLALTRTHRTRPAVLQCSPKRQNLLFTKLDLDLTEVPDLLDLLEDVSLKNLDQNCVHLIHYCRETDETQRLVTNINNFKLTMRAISGYKNLMKYKISCLNT